MTSVSPTIRAALHSLASVTVLALLAACAAPSAPADIAHDDEPHDLGMTTDPLVGWPARGEGSAFALMPTLPFPEGIVVVGDRVYVSGPATFGTAGKGASQVRGFDRRTGAQVATIAIAGEDLAREHALGCITSDAQGRLYALSTQLGVVRLTRSGASFAQDIYAPLPPDLAPCAPNATTAACSPTTFDGPPLPNDLAFDWAGNLYVTDSLQAIVFRIPPGGGTPQVWFKSPSLTSVPFSFGLNGMRVSPDQTKVFVTVTRSAQNVATGNVFSIRRVASPTENDLALVHAYTANESPDGLSFGLTGKLYVALAGANAISVLGHDGAEQARYFGPAGSSVPFDGPANIAFDGRGSLLVTNHAVVSGNAASFAVLDMFVADLAFPLAKPFIP
jgi:sugar lactone lactonase YvrE